MKPREPLQLIDQNTNLYISASGRPGSFGALVFNEIFKNKNINAVYIPRKFETPAELAYSIKALLIQGCGVSSPLKNSILNYLDVVDELALKLSSVNTIKNSDNQLIGFNTDWSGAKSVLEEKFPGLAQRPKSARILGSGGVVSSLIYALKSLGITDIEVVYRNKAAVEKLSARWQIDIKSIDDKAGFDDKDILINTIPTTNDENNFIFTRFVPHSILIFDLVVNPEDTSLIQLALKEKKAVIRGHEMAMHQLIEQYCIYFNERLTPAEVLRIIQKKYLKEIKNV